MKIVYLTNVLSPYRNDFFNLLSVDFPELTVITYNESKELLAWEDTEFVKNYTHVELKGGVIKKLLHVFFLIRDYSKYNSFFLGGYGSVYESFALIISKLFNVRIVLNVDGYILENSKIKKFLKVFLINLSCKILVSGIVTKKNLIAEGVKRNIIVYYFSSTFENEFNKGSKIKDFDILFVGSLSRRKGILEFLNFFVEENLNLKMGVIGDGPLSHELLSLFSSNSNIVFLGKLSRNEVFKFIRKSNILVIPSYKDIWGLVVNEGVVNNATLFCSLEVMSAFDLITEGVNGFFFDVHSLSRLTKDDLYNAMHLNLENKTVLNKSLAKLYCIENMVLIHKNIVYGE